MQCVTIQYVLECHAMLQFLGGVILFVAALGLIRHLFGTIVMAISIPVILTGLLLSTL
jgi:hypothetical protein